MKTWPLTMALAVLAGTAEVSLCAEGAPKTAKSQPVTITQGPDWLPLDVNLDIEPGSALDFTRVIPRHEPAGKFGRVIVNKQGKFAFQKRATPSRFYGVDLCCTAQFLPHELADRLSDRLVRLGYNTVRIHHYERWLEERVDGKTRFNAERMEQFDYLFAALKRRGIYITTDLYVSRLVAVSDIHDGKPEASGLAVTPRPKNLGDWTFEDYYLVGHKNVGVQEFKFAVFIDDRAYENYKAFGRALLAHVNPYTKLRYADDPALGWISVMNEDCPSNYIDNLRGHLRDQWQREWNRWLAQRYPSREALVKAIGDIPADQDPAKGNVPMPKVSSRDAGATFNSFLAEIVSRFYERTRKFLRDEMHCKALLTDCNGWSEPIQVQAIRNKYDYVDDHFYVDHPDFKSPFRQPPSRCANTNPVAAGGAGVAPAAFTRLFGKPYVITEFNFCGPSQYRGVGGILTGAMAAVQDWDALWRHVYSYSRENIERPAALSYFDVVADPLTQAAERAAMCLFLRGDLQPAKHAISISSTPTALLNSPKLNRDRAPGWQSLAWLAQVGWAIEGEPKSAKNAVNLSFTGSELNLFQSGTQETILKTFRDNHWLSASNLTDFKQKRFQSETGDISLDANESVFAVETARTVGGFALAGKRIQTRTATIDVQDADATVWVSSLDGKPIASSKRLLITHLTDLQNTGTTFAAPDRKMLTAWGQLPHLVRAGRATVTLHMPNAAHAKVHALAVNGKRMGVVQAESGRGVLSIPLSVAADGKARMLYEVEIPR